jgi:RNA polymerase sigma-70 factor (ECF subfamily)
MVMNAEPREINLARRARDDDREALAELVERSRLGLFSLAYAELRHYEDAQDAVATALFQICRSVGALREPDRARAWMASIVRREARRLLGRRAAAPLSLEAAEEAPAGPGFGPLPGEREAAVDAGPRLMRLDVQRALRQLPRDEARALSLAYLAGLPVHEIAARVGRPEGTIKRWLHQGRQHLVPHMEGYAPMTPTAAAPIPAAAAILSTEMDPAVLQSLVDAMKAAGWDDVATVGTDLVVEFRDNGDTQELHLASPLQGRRFIVLDDWISGRSAFELHLLLKATPEAKEIKFGLLSGSAKDSTVRAAWLAGIDLFLIKPIDPAEFQEFSRRVRVGEC